MEEERVVDALIIGGGPAGLSASLPIIRQRFEVIVFDTVIQLTDEPKNLKTHLIPGLDHQDKDELMVSAADDLLKRYDTLTLERTNIRAARKLEANLFEVEDDRDKKWRGRKLVLAQGVRHIFPDIKGYDECWGKGIYRCCFCNAFEDRGADSVGVIAVDFFGSVEMALHGAQDIKRFAKEVIIYTNGNEDLTRSLAAAIPNPRMKISQAKIERIEKTGSGGECTVHLEDGTKRVEGFLGHMPFTRPRGSFVEDLGLETEESGDIKVYPPWNRTSMPGVFAAGDVCSVSKIVSHAFFLGNLAGAGVAEELLADLPAPVVA